MEKEKENRRRKQKKKRVWDLKNISKHIAVQCHHNPYHIFRDQTFESHQAKKIDFWV